MAARGTEVVRRDDDTARASRTPRAGASEFELLMAWIRDQRRYFARKAKAEETRRRLEASTVEWLLKASGAMSVVLALTLAAPFLGHRSSERRGHGSLRDPATPF